MKLSNFEHVKTKGTSPLNWEYFASVDVTIKTGFLWLKKITTKKIIMREYAGYWHFVETGKYAPLAQIEELERSWNASQSFKGMAKNV